MIKLVIFDVDGVLLDSETLYIDSTLEFCKKNGYPIPREVLMKTIGSGRENHRRVFKGFMGEDFDYETYIKKEEECFENYKRLNPPKIKKGAFELLDYLKKHGISTALATSTDKDRQLHNFEASGLDHPFDFMVFGDDITRHKPDPEIYEIVLDHFGYPKDEVLIIEDSINGINSGLNAGVKVIFIPDEVEVPEELVAKTYRKLDDLSQVIEVIEELGKV